MSKINNIRSRRNNVLIYDLPVQGDITNDRVKIIELFNAICSNNNLCEIEAAIRIERKEASTNRPRIVKVTNS